MVKRYLACGLIVLNLLCVSGAGNSWGQFLYGEPSGGTPSVPNYGWRGLGMGALAGTAAGFIQYSDNGDSDDILLGAGYGSLIGAGLGLVLGAIDVQRGQRGMGDIILRDMNRASGFGAAVGSIWGGVNAIINEDWEELGRGAAWGYLGGLALGAVVALYEGPGIVEKMSRQQVSLGISFLKDSRRNACPVYRFTYRFMGAA